MDKYILSLDQRTTSSRAVIFDKNGNAVGVYNKKITQISPQPDWIEHDPTEIYTSQLFSAKMAMANFGISGSDLDSIGVTNQRETTVVWNRNSGLPIYNAIVWQDRRTNKIVEELKQKGYAQKFQEKTGLILDSYFSATKLKWILDHVPDSRELAKNGELAFGTIDTWLIWKLTNGRSFVTDESNASRTLLYNIHTGDWDKELLEILDIPYNMLPKVVPSSGIVGETSSSLFGTRVRISGIIGDQQSSTFGNACITSGMAKCTYDTGCFLLMNTENQAIPSKNKLITTIGWNLNNKRTYCQEGSIFIGGAVTQWVRDGLKLINESSQIEHLATTVPDNGGVYFIPAIGKVDTVFWNQNAKGAIFGITRNTTNAHIARAALESIAYQVADLVWAIQSDTETEISVLRVNGEASKNNFLMQFQADILDIAIERPKCQEISALGAAYLAGLATGYWKSIDELESLWTIDAHFEPKMSRKKREHLLDMWHKAAELTVPF